jgi:hypothetical protein
VPRDAILARSVSSVAASRILRSLGPFADAFMRIEREDRCEYHDLVEAGEIHRYQTAR